MQTYQLTFKVGGRFQSLPDSQTIFGALCWAIRDLYGEAKLTEMLSDFVNHPQRFVVSSMFLHDLFPMPKLEKPLDELTTLAEFQNAKAVRSLKFISHQALQRFFDKKQDMSSYQQLLKGKSQQVWQIKNQTLYLLSETPQPLPLETSGLRNAIDRLTQTTGDEGQLFYAQHQQVAANTQTHLIVQTEDIEFLQSLFTYLSDGGYGRDKSVGFNHFVFETTQPFVFENSINRPYLLSKYLPESGEVDWQNSELRYSLSSPNYVVESRQQFSGQNLKAQVVYFNEGSIVPQHQSKVIYGQLPVVQEIDGQQIYQNGLGLFL